MAIVFTGGTIRIDGHEADVDRLVVVDGAVAEARHPLPDDAEHIDLEGGLLLPAFGDGHAHPLLAGRERTGPALRDAGSVDEIVERVRAWGARSDAPWLIGGSYDATVAPAGCSTRAGSTRPFPTARSCCTRGITTPPGSTPRRCEKREWMPTPPTPSSDDSCAEPTDPRREPSSSVRRSTWSSTAPPAPRCATTSRRSRQPPKFSRPTESPGCRKRGPRRTTFRPGSPRRGPDACGSTSIWPCGPIRHGGPTISTSSFGSRRSSGASPGSPAAR